MSKQDVFEELCADLGFACPGSLEAERIWEAFQALPESAQPAERADEALLEKACEWLDARGFAAAATDLLCNWNDPGNPGDGSCRVLGVAPPTPQPKEET